MENEQLQRKLSGLCLYFNFLYLICLKLSTVLTLTAKIYFYADVQCMNFLR